MENYKILVVDDNIETLQTIIRFLEKFHPEYRLYQATDGNTAIRLTEKISFDLIISDWDMPEMSGINLLKILKINQKTMHIPVIIVTGVMLTSKDLDTALAEGAFDFIKKPVDPLELSARTYSALRLANSHHIEIEKKNVELLEKSLNLIKDSEYYREIQKKLNKLIKNLNNKEEVKAQINTLCEEINQKIKQGNWQRFEIEFINLNPEFSKNLLLQFPHLTPGELKLCMFIKLGMNVKDISSLLYLSTDSLKVARSRLRKKLQIEKGINLQTFLLSYE